MGFPLRGLTGTRMDDGLQTALRAVGSLTSVTLTEHAALVWTCGGILLKLLQYGPLCIFNILGTVG